jgi:hypothetical protein
VLSSAELENNARNITIGIVTILFHRLDFAFSTQSSDRGALSIPGAFSDGDRFEAASLAGNYVSLSDKGTCCEISTLSDSCLLDPGNILLDNLTRSS